MHCDTPEQRQLQDDLTQARDIRSSVMQCRNSTYSEPGTKKKECRMPAKSTAKSIGVTIRFWNIQPGEVDPKYAWAAGTIYVQASEAHGLAGGDAIPFNAMSEILPRLEEALVKSRVILRIGSPANKLYDQPDWALGGKLERRFRTEEEWAALAEQYLQED
jgi:hypothetical protein